MIGLDQVWVACDPNDVHGMVLASVRCGNGYIEELDVLPEHGKRGPGTRLIKKGMYVGTRTRLFSR